jgi:hypothetical protein
MSLDLVAMRPLAARRLAHATLRLAPAKVIVGCTTPWRAARYPQMAQTIIVGAIEKFAFAGFIMK